MKTNPSLKSKIVVSAPVNTGTDSAQNTETTNYTFLFKGSGDENCYAQYDHAGDSIVLYMNEFTTHVKDLNVPNHEDILISLLVGVLIHEDMHRGIVNSDVDHHNVDEEHGVIESMFYDKIRT